jgi:tetratricopeptide (TPR) repeat protein
VTGKLGDSERYLQAVMAASEGRGDPGGYLAGAARLALLQVDFRGRPDSGTAVLAAALAKHPLDSVPALDRPYWLLVLTYAKLGRLDVARRLSREGEASVPEPIRRGEPRRWYAAGALAEAEGRQADAASAYRSWYEQAGECTSCGLFDLARLADRAGQADSAIALYDRALSAPGLNRVMLDAFQLAPALKRAGELYEAKGDRAKAAARYRRFVELWKNADPELQPGVREVRARLGRLATETPS